MALLDAALPTLPSPSETGRLGIYQLKRTWARLTAAMRGQSQPATQHDRHLDHLVIHACGIGLEQNSFYFSRHAPSFDEFECWIAETSGGVEPQRVARINAAVAGLPYPDNIARWLAAVEASEPVLSAADLTFWNQHGYVVLHDAVPAATNEAAAAEIWRHLDARPDDPASWYRRGDHGIMVQHFQHPAFEANRRSPRIHKAFAQLWGSADLWCTTRPRRLQRARARGLAISGPASALGLQRQDADPLRHARYSLSHRHAARAGRLHLGARLPALGRGLAEVTAARR